MKPRRQSQELRVAQKPLAGAPSPSPTTFSAMSQLQSEENPSLTARDFAPQHELANDDESGPRRRDRWYTTGEMARLSSNTLRTVRFYEEAGILQPVGRTEGGHRLFARAELDRLMLVTDMREAGLSLEEIRNLLETKKHADVGPDGARMAIDALRRYMEELQRKVEVLARLHDDLAETVDTAARSLDCVHHGASANAPGAARGPSGAQLDVPSRCPICEAIAADRPLPRAMRVLWALPSDSSRAGSSDARRAIAQPSAPPKATGRSGVVARAGGDSSLEGTGGSGVHPQVASSQPPSSPPPSRPLPGTRRRS